MMNKQNCNHLQRNNAFHAGCDVVYTHNIYNPVADLLQQLYKPCVHSYSRRGNKEIVQALATMTAVLFCLLLTLASACAAPSGRQLTMSGNACLHMETLPADDLP
ncbi:hypothetical protein FHG87_018703 [Trinorchestia longiramus]|nr:hypothetical protein FHG87_018703 [Trinorchestia longiramus]